MEKKFPNKAYKKYLMNVLYEISLKRDFHKYMLECHKAHLVMLLDTGILDKSLGFKIKNSLQSLEKSLGDISLDDFVGNSEDLFFVLEEKMIKEIGLDAAGALHTARSRNDLFHVMFRLAFRDKLLHLMQLYFNLLEGIYEKGKSNISSVIMAWTHGQPAQPTTFGHYLAGLLESLLRDMDRLLHNYEYVDVSPYGAVAITTTGFPINRYTTAELLGFIGPIQNSYGALCATDYVFNTFGVLKGSAVTMGRFNVDMLDWSMFEVAQINLSNDWAQVSSVMPQKRNLVVFEHLRARMSSVSAMCDIPTNSLKSVPFGDINDQEIEYHDSCLEVFDHIESAILLLSSVVPDITVNTKNVLKDIDKSCAVVTELADCLVRFEKISFRQAHTIASSIAKHCVKNKLKLSEIEDSFMTKVIKKELKRDASEDTCTIRNLLNVENFISARKVYGGVAKETLEGAYDSYKKDLDSLKVRIDKIKSRHARAKKKLNAKFSAISSV